MIFFFYKLVAWSTVFAQAVSNLNIWTAHPHTISVLIFEHVCIANS